MITQYPLGTEKSIRLMEAENKLIFVVDPKATKTEIKEDLKKRFKADVKSVNTHHLRGRKKAVVTFGDGTLAIDIATKLGLL